MQNFIHFFKEGQNNPGYLRQTEPPYIIGKITKFRDQENADDYAAKQVNYAIGRVEGYNVFITHAGFLEPPDTLISDDEIQAVINRMCHWYYKNKIEGKKIVVKTFKIKQ